VKLNNSFRIDRPVPEVYDAFLDVERIATCMPGSRLLGEPEPGTYEGEVKVKVGPLGVAYTGQFTVLDADEAGRVLRMRAKGREQRGAGNADAHIVATMHEDGGGTRVDIDTDLSIRGKVAQFGRGVIGDVTDEIMQAFARNVEQLLTSGGAAAPSETTGAAAPSAAPTGQPTRESSSEPAQRPTADAAPAEPAAAGGELDAWSMIVRPMLQRHAGQVAQLALAAAAAYLGGRAGARAGRADPAPRRRRPHLHYY
jgi:carbon monoxide dehydrogenase subunit G